jgi:hypothetical protein
MVAGVDSAITAGDHWTRVSAVPPNREGTDFVAHLINFQLNKWQRRLLIALGIAGYVGFTWAVIRIG